MPGCAGRITSVALLATLLVAAPRLAWSQGTKQSDPDTASNWDHGWVADPVSNHVLDGKVRESIPRYKAFAPVPRVAFYNITYPKDCRELTAMGGFAISVITAFAQDSTELPPGRVFVHTAAGNRRLVPYAAVESRVAASDSAIVNTFGSYRGDFLYLFPSDQARAIGDLVLDFAVHFSGYRLAHFDGETPRILLMCTPVLRTERSVDSTVVWTMFRREYPDLARTFSGLH